MHIRNNAKERNTHMQNSIKKALLDKNQKLINMVIERAKRDFPEDIALIGLTGSFSTGDFHEKSDLVGTAACDSVTIRNGNTARKLVQLVGQ
jgi:hypothetical protein